MEDRWSASPHSTLMSLRADRNKLKGIASLLFIMRLMLFCIEHTVFINYHPLKYVFNTTCVLHSKFLAVLLNNIVAEVIQTK